MRNLIHGIVAFVGLATVSFTSTPLANAEASGDGFRGPIVFTDLALDQSLQALNAFMVDRYAQDDKLAAITAPTVKEFREVAVATGEAPRSTNFYVEASHPSGEMFFSHIEVQVHRALDFVEVVEGFASDRPLYSLELAPAASGTEFGGPVYDAPSLDAHTVALNVHIEELAARDGLLNFNPPPPMTQISFDAYATAMNLSYN